MIINEIQLKSFGKFKNKTIKLKEGVNIIYGRNEEGKTTIHKFIEGMLYGFFKPYVKRRVYTEDFQKYYPWNQDMYNGVLKYSFGGNNYRIERDFLKSNGEVKLYDDETGEDITYMLEYDKVTRLSVPASLHLGISSVIFNNTISIRQMGAKTGNDLVKEVKDSLVNLGGTMDEDISLKRAIEELEKKMDSIGTKGRVKTSPYGRIVEELEALELEKEEALQTMNSVKEYQIKLNEIYKGLNEFNAKKKAIEKSIGNVESYKLRERLREAELLITEMKNLEDSLKELDSYSKLNNDKYGEVISLQSKLAALDERIKALDASYKKQQAVINELNVNIEELSRFEVIKDSEDVDNITREFTLYEERKEQLQSLDSELNKLNKKLKNSDGSTLLTLEEELNRYEEIEDERNKLLLNTEYSNLISIKAKINEKEKSYGKAKVLMLFLIIASIVAVTIGFITRPIFSILSVIPISLLTFTIFSSKGIKIYLKGLYNQLEEYEAKEKDRNNRIKELEGILEELLRKNNSLSKADLRRNIGEYSRDITLMKENQILQNGMKSKRDKLLSEIEIQEEHLYKYIKLGGTELQISMEGIRLVRELYNKYTGLKRDRGIKTTELKASAEELKGLREAFENINETILCIMKNNGITTIEEFRIGLEKKKEYDRIISLLENKEILLRKVLGDYDIDTLKKSIAEYPDYKPNNADKVESEELIKELDNIRVQILNHTEEAARLEEYIKLSLSSLRSLAQIEEDIARKRKTKEDYELDLKSLEVAKNTIEMISKNLHKEFAPKLNVEVSDIVNKITSGKYADVRVTEDLNIKVVDAESGKYVEVESLSFGTIDQLYFAMRFGIIDIIKENSEVPLILDDCFAQYDIIRLENVLRILIEESTKRQIIILTCHSREKELLEKMKAKHNYLAIKNS